jgi:hypothetical protein
MRDQVHIWWQERERERDYTLRTEVVLYVYTHTYGVVYIWKHACVPYCVVSVVWSKLQADRARRRFI